MSLGLRTELRRRNGRRSRTLASLTSGDEAGTAESTRVPGEWLHANLPELEIAPPNVSSGEVLIAV